MPKAIRNSDKGESTASGPTSDTDFADVEAETSQSSSLLSTDQLTVVGETEGGEQECMQFHEVKGKTYEVFKSALETLVSVTEHRCTEHRHLQLTFQQIQESMAIQKEEMSAQIKVFQDIKNSHERLAEANEGMHANLTKLLEFLINNRMDSGNTEPGSYTEDL